MNLLGVCENIIGYRFGSRTRYWSLSFFIKILKINTLGFFFKTLNKYINWQKKILLCLVKGFVAEDISNIYFNLSVVDSIGKQLGKYALWKQYGLNLDDNLELKGELDKDEIHFNDVVDWCKDLWTLFGVTIYARWYEITSNMLFVCHLFIVDIRKVMWVLKFVFLFNMKLGIWHCLSCFKTIGTRML
jgi:hypothetical protein